MAEGKPRSNYSPSRQGKGGRPDVCRGAEAVQTVPPNSQSEESSQRRRRVPYLPSPFSPWRSPLGRLCGEKMNKAICVEAIRIFNSFSGHYRTQGYFRWVIFFSLLILLLIYFVAR